MTGSRFQSNSLRSYEPKGRRRIGLVVGALGVLLVVSACTGASNLGPTTVPGGAGGAAAVSREAYRLTPAQECAVGYDLAQQIYNTVAVNGTAIRLTRSAGGCSKYAAEYLRRAGFAVTENASGSGQFAISTYAIEGPAEIGAGPSDGFIAVAHLPGFVVSRAYRPGEGGVYALSPVSVRAVGIAQ